jgi:hypothetical protein
MLSAIGSRESGGDSGLLNIEFTMLKINLVFDAQPVLGHIPLTNTVPLYLTHWRGVPVFKKQILPYIGP